MPERGPPVTVTHPPGRLTRGLLALLAGLALLALAGVSPSAGAATVAQQLGALPTIQPFNGEATSRSQFSTRWSVFSFTFEGQKGSDTTAGWSSNNAYPNINGAYDNSAAYTAAYGGAAAAVTLGTSTESPSRSFSLWLDATNLVGGGRQGYELRFAVTGEETFTVALVKHSGGVETTLASQRNVEFVEGESLAIVDEGGIVSAWTNSGAGFTQRLRASDATFDSGSVGLSSNSNFFTLRTFKAGQLAPAAPTLTRTNPASPSDDTAPFVIGTATSGTTVKLYTDATCRGSVAATGTAAAFASPGLQATVAESATTSIYATATDNLNNASDCSRAISYTQDPTIGIAAALAGLTTLDAFGTAQNPLSGGGRWSRLAWASNTGQVAGSGTSGGWAPASGYPVVSGASWNPTTFADTGRGVAVAGTLSVGAELANRWFSLWLDMAEPGSAQSGYELRFTLVGEEEEPTYNVTLTKWASGTRTALARTSGYTLAPQSSFALVDKGGNVYAWVDAGSGYRQLLGARDATYSRGYAGIEGAGNITRVRSFRAGAL